MTTEYPSRGHKKKNKETKKQRNKETKKQRNKETKKQRNKETKKQKTKQNKTKLLLLLFRVHSLSSFPPWVLPPSVG